MDGASAEQALSGPARFDPTRFDPARFDDLIDAGFCATALGRRAGGLRVAPPLSALTAVE